MPLNVLMISIDRGLLGQGQLGDVVERHIAYGANSEVGRLDIIVLCRGARQPYSLSPKVTAYPTNSRTKVGYYRDALRLGLHLANQQTYDLVVTQEPFVTGFVGLRLKRRLGIKLLVHHHGDFLLNPYWVAERPLRHRLLQAMARYVTRRADAVRAMSQGIADKVVRLGLPRRAVRVISTPVNLQKFTPSQAAARSSPVVLTVGRNDRAKDFPTLYRAIGLVAHRVPDVALHQVGAAGVAEQSVRSAIGAAIAVQVTPRVDQAGLAAYYQACDVYVSSSAHESFGKVLVEANACGKPVVATATTGARDIVQDGVNGFLVPVGDSAALAEKIVYLLQHPDEARVMGERGRKLVAERFDGAKNTRAIVQFWQDIVEGTINTPPPREPACRQAGSRGRETTL